MELHRFGPDDEADVRRYVELSDALRRADSPWQYQLTDREAVARVRDGWDGEPFEHYLAWHDGEVVGVAAYFAGTWDNQHLAWVQVRVAPEHRRRGHGSAMLQAMVDRARAEGRRTVGTDGWDSPAAIAFAEKQGLAQASVGVIRRQVLADVDWAVVEALHKEAAERASAYDLMRTIGPSDPAVLPEIAEITAAINDAPTDELDIEDEVFPPERVARYEEVQVARGLFHRIVARHRDTGKLAGQTVVVVDAERPEIGEQHDTSVVAAHRGHRLGVLLKTEMLLWLRETQPQLATIDTGNAETNDHMIGINEQLGYRVMARELEFQRSL